MLVYFNGLLRKTGENHQSGWEALCLCITEQGTDISLGHDPLPSLVSRNFDVGAVIEKGIEDRPKRTSEYVPVSFSHYPIVNICFRVRFYPCVQYLNIFGRFL